ncbi:OLC1v1037915C1 [Oldenlandia corymbosa var. corymbosa]|uniref:Transcription initiation factor IIF subunit alpha n=1 Tax=Oldenlandia corymbosa var. corymbosa TaxID=529605 RepID=A0AAV1CYI2_OLDCO|nr:OLC1v1037915C1 [Oldenlandia corymbosa var. corymbosa]
MGDTQRSSVFKESLEASKKESHKNDKKARHELLEEKNNNNTCSPRSTSAASVVFVTPGPTLLVLKSCLRRKKKGDEDPKNEPLLKKVRFDNEGKSVRIIEIPTKNAGRKPSRKKSVSTTTPASTAGPFTEEEIRTVIVQNGPITARQLVGTFKLRFKT